jgi:hypothetical protein
MKKLLLTAAAILATLNMYGQGTGVISFGNVNSPSPSDRIWVNDTGVVGEGTGAAGTSYKIALFYAASTTATEAQLVQIGPASGFIGAGQFSAGNRTVNTAGANGDPVTVQARAWGTIAGLPDTYEAVLAAGLAGDQRAYVGVGNVFVTETYRPGDPTDPAVAIHNDPNWRGFSISPVPEPSVIGLGLLGAGALLMLRRRK